MVSQHMYKLSTKKGENILNEAATKPKADRVSNTVQIFFLNVIVIAKDNRHYVIFRSEKVKEHIISQGTLER